MVKSRYAYPFWLSLFFCQFVNGLTEFYPELYEQGAGVASQHQVNFSKKWGNYSSIVELANGDIDRIDMVTKQPLEKCLLLLSYKADKGYVEQLIHDEALRQAK